MFTAATHGWSDQGGDYLVATDSVWAGLLDTALKLPTLFDRIAQLPAKRRLVLLDACRERLNEKQRSVAEADPAMAASFAAAIGRAVGQTVLMGSVAGGYSYDDTRKQNGVFSGALVDGLCGSAKADSEGWITVGAVAEFACERVQEFVRRHRKEHVIQSRGIEERYDENARSLPLAIDPARTRALEAYRLRRAAAVEHLHRNIGGDLDGRRIEDIKEFLPTAGLPNAEAEELLTEIDALDGSPRSKRSVLFLFEKLRTGEATPVSDEAPLPAEVSPHARVGKLDSPGTPEGQKVSRSAWTSAPQKWLIGTVLSVSILSLVRLFLPDEKAEPLVMMAPPPEVNLEQSKVEPTKKPVPELGVMTDSFGQRYRWVPGGKYTIGSPQKDEDPERDASEKGLRDVTLAGFWLAETEFTQEQWSGHGLKNPSQFATCADCPVEKVSWWEAAEFANLLSTKAKRDACYDLKGCTGELGTAAFVCSAVKVKSVGCTGYRLPTEDEWEVAARGRNVYEPYEARYGPLRDIAWYDRNSKDKTHPVGSKEMQPNAWGFKDMLGNVWEWTESVQGQNKVLRGGGWSNPAQHVRTGFHTTEKLGERQPNIGFRLLLGLPAPSPEK